VQIVYARAWSEYEARCSTLLPNPELVRHFAEEALGLARIEAHYFAHGCFLAPNHLLLGLDRIRHLAHLGRWPKEGDRDVLIAGRDARRAASAASARGLGVSLGGGFGAAAGAAFSASLSLCMWGVSAADDALIDLLAASLAPRARANVIALAPTLPGIMEKEDDAMFARLAARAPLGRTGDISEILTTLDFLLASPGVTGQVLSLGNGMNLATARPS
jgi:hypothetical protein